MSITAAAPLEANGRAPSAALLAPVTAEPAGEQTGTLVVIAKRPVAGRVKTRLQTRFTPDQAARLAGASLRDTLDAMAAAPARRRVVALDHAGATGARRTSWLPGSVLADFDVVSQGTGGLDERLATTFEAVLGHRAGRPAPGPALLVGMDTPQLTPALLTVDWTGLDAVLGLALDGGFWAIGFRESAPEALRGVPMSTDHTGADQLERLLALGLRVGMLPVLRDVDAPPDAAAAAAMAPSSRFARLHARMTARESRSRRSAVHLLEDAFAGGAVDALTPAGSQPLRSAAWTGTADAADHAILDLCEGSVLDVGCGPGRMVRALLDRGHSTLGIDASRVAVAATARRGGPVLHRRVEDLLPREGLWGTVLLADGNIGIGGDPQALLERAAHLVAPGGRVVVEVESGDDDLDVRDAVVLQGVAGERSRPAAWAWVGARSLAALGARCGLELVDRLALEDREVVVLRRPPLSAGPAPSPAREVVSAVEPEVAAGSAA